MTLDEIRELRRLYTACLEMVSCQMVPWNQDTYERLCSELIVNADWLLDVAEKAQKGEQTDS